MERCQRVAGQASRIHISALDGIEFIRGLADAGAFFFIDPPYFGKGPALYLNALDPPYHALLAQVLRKMKDSPWVLTYDDCAEVRAPYEEWAAVRSYSLRYSASSRRRGGALLIAPRWMISCRFVRASLCGHAHRFEGQDASCLTPGKPSANLSRCAGP